MEYRALGASGLKVSAVGFGGNPFGDRVDQAGADAIVGRALDLGITFFDTADVYPPSVPGAKGRSEEILGQALGKRRKEVVLATKFGMPMGPGPYEVGGSRRHVFNAVEASLRRLGTDYIDLYQMHFPDPATPIEETLLALADLRQQGKIRYIGACNFRGWQVMDAAHRAKAAGVPGFVASQNYYNLLQRHAEDERLPGALAAGAGFIPYFPLASGLLTGKYRRGEAPPEGTRLATNSHLAYVGTWELTERNFDVVEQLEAYGREHGFTLLQLAVGWLLAQPGVATLMAGATKVEQLEENTAAAAVKLAPEDVAALNRIAAPQGGLPY